jgi:hypothetical protein
MWEIQPCSDAAEPALFHKGDGAHRLNSTARDAISCSALLADGKKRGGKQVVEVKR